jgi:ferredoxin/flavodoxin
MLPNEVKHVKILYYSGTGNTRKVAGCFEDCLKDKEVTVQTYSVVEKNIPQVQEEELLLLVYAVYALNAPEVVYRWIDNLPVSQKKRAAVISVSGGGEVSANTACRVGCIRRLEKKGYSVIYETMLVMPSNFIVATHEALAVKLLEVLPYNVAITVSDILSGVRRRTKPLWLDRCLSWMGELEKIGAKEFGKRIMCSEDCIGCGSCSNNCPAENIKMEGGRPVFGKQCHLCLSCLYGCPRKALSPGIMKFIMIKEGYNLKQLEKKVPWSEPVNVKELTKGYIWSGIRKYLLSGKIEVKRGKMNDKVGI